MWDRTMLQALGRRWTKGEAGSPPDEVRVGVFGKHPAWQDYIPPLDDPPPPRLLPEFADLLGRDGIPYQTQQGRWRRLEAEGQALPFGHVLVYGRSRHMLCGRLWPSRDGVRPTPRSFPLVACLEAPQRRLTRFVPLALEALAALEPALMQAAMKNDVVASLHTCREEVRGASLPPDPAADPPPEDPIEQLRRHADMGAGGEKLSSVLGVFEEYLNDGLLAWAVRRGSGQKPADDVRVPWCASTAEAALVLWSRLAQRLARGEPFLVAMPLGQPFLDLFIGTMQPAQFYFLRAPLHHRPLTTAEAPPLDDRVRRRIDAFLSTKPLPA